MHNLQLVLLKGSELDTIETRKQFSFETRFRVLPKNAGIYGGDRVLDIEEIVVSTDTMSFDDYIETRKYHLVSSVFWNDSWFSDAVALAQKFGVKRSAWFDAMLPALENTPGAVREFLDHFVGETKGELFPTYEECRSFYCREENFKRLINGDIGDNLMYKYRAIASFFIWPDIAKAAIAATRRLVEAHGDAGFLADVDEFWEDFELYVRAKHADGRTEEQILSPVTVRMRYDIGQSIANGMSLDAIDGYRLAEREEFEFSLSEEGTRELRAVLRVWTTALKGMTKMVTRVRMAWQVRQAMSFSHGGNRHAAIPRCGSTRLGTFTRAGNSAIAVPVGRTFANFFWGWRKHQTSPTIQLS